MPATTSCRCDARDYRHAHCFCAIYNCNGKAVSRSTYQHHQKADEGLHIQKSKEATASDGEDPQNIPGKLMCTEYVRISYELQLAGLCM